MCNARQMISSWIGWLVYPALGLPLTAATVTLSAVADTSIFQANPDSDLGGSSLVAGTNYTNTRSRAMFRFDLGTLPPGAVVSGVEVSLYVSRVPDPDMRGNPVSFDFNLHRLLMSWGEGAGSTMIGTVAMPGDATWNARHFGRTPWASPGALIGVDYAEVASEDETSLGSGRRFGSREQSGGEVSPPQLRVTYTLVPEPGGAGLCLVGLAALALRRVRQD